MNMPAAHQHTGLDLQSLLDGFADAPALPLSDIATDSRRLVPGSLFIACQGGTVHGLDFLDQAIAAGAAAVAWDSTSAEPRPADIPMVAVPDLAQHVGELANRWFGAPSAALRVSGVTGTNGKTTVAWLIRQCLQALGKSCAYIGTLGGGLGTIDDTGGMTTPDCVELHRLMAACRDAGATHAALEVSSHALSQGRIDGLHFDTALFTNLSRDHIDYHGSMASYGAAKARLFLEHTVGHRIVCIDSPFGQELAERLGPDHVAVTTGDAAPVKGARALAATSVSTDQEGSDVTVRSDWGNGELRVPLPGFFNVANALQVLATMLVSGVAFDEACALVGRFTAPPGRMQRIAVEGDRLLPAVYVDYSHTPASLEVGLSELRRHCRGKLWCVFGCGGDRDRGKRKMMGETASTLADVVIVTNDNPRTEPPGQIIEDILEGIAGDVTVLEDRTAAITHAIHNAGPGDAVLLAGKGHENYQIIGTRTLPFSDYELARTTLEARAGEGA